MKLALIGADEESLDLARWAASLAGHQLVSAYDVGPFAGELRSFAPGVRLNEEWESLLVSTEVDVVVVGRGAAGLSNQTGIPEDERRADQLRKLAQAAVPMLIFVPACEAIVGFEIEMIRNDVGGIIWPYMPWYEHPGICDLVNLAAPGTTTSGAALQAGAAPIGPIVQVVFERQQADRSRQSVLAQLARDVMYMSWLVGGEIRTVNAAGSTLAPRRDPLGPRPKELPSLENLSVTIGSEKRTARWSIGPVLEHEGAMLTLIGERGRAMLSMPTLGAWSLEIVGEIRKQKEYHCRLEDDYRKAIRVFPSPRPETREAKWPYWLDACRCQEVAEAVDRSLARGRTIELFNEQHTEEQSFKGVMAMGGCLLLVLALGVMFLATIVEGLQLPLRDWVAWKWWPAYLLAPVVLFLLLQLLQLAIKREPAKVQTPAE